MEVEINFKASLVHISFVYMYLNRKNFTFIKRIREPSFCEPNLCEPSSHNYSVNFDLWFTCFHSTKISREPVNHGSQITSAPTFIGF
jgi:hypothetical protein